MRRKSVRELRGRMLEHIRECQYGAGDVIRVALHNNLASEIAWAMNIDVPTTMMCGFCRGKIPLRFGQSKCPECGRDLDICIRDYNISNFRREAEELNGKD